jgi:hypothetical protein
MPRPHSSRRFWQRGRDLAVGAGRRRPGCLERWVCLRGSVLAFLE